MNDRPIWFSAKCYGLGSGLPCSWQGWAILTGYMTIVIATSIIFERKPLVLIAIVLPLTILLMVICARTTRGGWRWRWGSDD